MVRVRRSLALIASLLLCACAGGAGTDISGAPTPDVDPATLAAFAKGQFGGKRAASAQTPEPFGSYARGCVAGAEQLAETGPTWQAMRLSRNRNWGHPELVDYIQRLSQKAAAQPGWNGLYIGDMSQPRGGPMLTG
ncbi:MAG: penicillin-insensitive murein endopeptidase, partial [Pseudomonadota bacterium]